MYRPIEKALLEWKNDKNHVPMILRGARQVGKSHVVQKFAKEHFQSFVEINFEIEPLIAQQFDELDINRLVANIEIIKGQSLTPGESLLFLDEIQACPKAIMALRYFKEKLPGLHVIAASSLLEFSLSAEGFSMPVGRVQYLYMQPMSFAEYLFALDQPRLLHYLESCQLGSETSAAIHATLEKHVKNYMLIGGMPAVVSEYLDSHSFQKCQRVQQRILTTYTDDFSKYANTSQHKYLQAVMTAAPGMVGQICKYSHIAREFRSTDLSCAVTSLMQAGVVFKVPATSASGLPLSVTQNAHKFKLVFLDIGLTTVASGLSHELLLTDDYFSINRGALMEQLVGQELLAYQDTYAKRELYFWVREKTGSMAEVDYVIQHGRHILPLEVKAGKTGRLKSMQVFMQEKKSPLGIKVCMEPLSLEKNILTVPVYLLKSLHKLIEEALR